MDNFKIRANQVRTNLNVDRIAQPDIRSIRRLPSDRTHSFQTTQQNVLLIAQNKEKEI